MRSIFTTLSCDEDGQYIFGLSAKRIDNLIYTKMGTNQVIPVNDYPNTFRRKIIDFAAKITFGSGYVILNIPRAIFDNFKIEDVVLNGSTTILVGT